MRAGGCGYDEDMEQTDPDERTPDNDAVTAAEQMNDPDGAQPGVVEEAPDPQSDEPLPEQMP